MLTPLQQLMNGRAPTDEVDVVVAKKMDLQDSEMTPRTETGSVSDDEAGGWFGGIGTDFRNLATSIKDTFPPAIGGIIHFVHRSAMSVAAEIAQLERDGELDPGRWGDENYVATKEGSGLLPLPWEIKYDLGDSLQDETPLYMANEELMDIIMALSLKEHTFRKPFSPQSDIDELSKPSFVMDDARIDLIRRLLDVDENLAAIHARLSGRSDVGEAAFWRNYFFHCKEARDKYLARRITPTQSNANSVDKIPDEVETNGDTSNALTLDDSSLVPASVPDDDSSYVLTSAPTSLNTYPDTTSVDDLVVVGEDVKERLDDKY